MKKTLSIILVIALILVCTSTAFADTLPPSAPDENMPFGVDKNINIETIDQYLDRDDTVYRDVRMLFDPADYASIGGDEKLSATIRGFKVVPYPYLATLTDLPVDNGYTGETLFDLTWNDDGSIASAKANYKESMLILEDLFPKDKHIFLLCGGGGYSDMTRRLLVFLGWDAELIYVLGTGWDYKGSNELRLIFSSDDLAGDEIFAIWRADYASIDFSLLHKIE